MSDFSDRLGRIKQNLDPELVALLQDLATGNSDRDLVAKTVTAALTGALTGSLTGTHTGAAALTTTVFTPVSMTASAAVPATASFIQLDKAGGKIEATLAPTAGRLLIITQIDAGTQGHTVTLGPGTWDGTNAIATFNAEGETLIVMGLSSTRYAILLNVGAVALS